MTTCPRNYAAALPACAGGLLLAAALYAEEPPWPSPVPNFQKVQAGEHPRLLFRKSDIPRLRNIAETPEGRALIARLRKQLNGSDGETLTTLFGTKGPVKTDGAGPHAKDPEGTYTISHTAGYGFLYQVTGNKKYADLGRESMDKALEGYRDRDQRYSFLKPYGALRGGPSIGWNALGYDLCYDGWDDAYRKKIAGVFSNYDEGPNLSLEGLARGKRQHPGSNHWGMEVGGAAMAILAIMNDPGVDMAKISPLLEASQQCMITNMTKGFGDGGFFAEGDGTGSMSSHIAFLSALQAWKTCYGLDYITPRWNARWMALKWIFLTIPKPGASMSSCFWPQRGGYPHNIWSRGDKSGGGYFGIGFAAVTQEEKAGLLWFYNHSGLKELDAKNNTPFDALSPYPHHTICAYVNWPWNMKERNPAEVIPRCYRDTKWSFYAFRNRWQDTNDIVISVLMKDTQGYMGARTDGALQVAAFGKKFKWGALSGDVKLWQPSPRGETSVLTSAAGVSLAVDFTKASGADGLLVTTAQASDQPVKVGGVTLSFKFLTAGPEPAVTVEGDKAVVGKQTISVKDGNIILGVTTRP